MLTSTSDRHHAGFTLIELLVVVLLLGLGLGVGLTMDFAGSPQQQKQQAVLLANTLELAAQEAVLDGAVLGLDFFATDAQGAVAYRWLRLQDTEWKAFLLPDTDAETVFPAGMTATLNFAGQTLVPEARTEAVDAATFAPEIILLPTRELTPFTLTLTGDAGSTSVLTADLMGRVRVDEDAPTPP